MKGVKRSIKRLVQRLIVSLVAILSKTTAGQFFQNQIVSTAMGQTVSIRHGQLVMTLAVPNWLSRWRIKTFSAKEPETLEWLDRIPKGSILWDVGANIGLYSVYAAQHRDCRVWAFEPSVFNLEILARNIFLNRVTDRICIVPFALSDKLGPNQMHMTTTDWGGALSTFGQDYGWDGKALRQVFEYQIFGLSMEDTVQRLLIPLPAYIKIDVDGIEHVILKGSRSVLSQVKEILIEINDDFHEQAEQCHQLLSEAGLVLKEKRHSEMIEGSTSGFRNSYNQIWIRP